MGNNQQYQWKSGLRKVSIIVAILALMAQVWGGLVLANDAIQEQPHADHSTSVETPLTDVIEAAVTYVAQLEPLSDWAALALAKANHAVPDSYTASIVEAVTANEGQFRRVTDLERSALTLSVLGYDVRDFEGYDLIDLIVNHEGMVNQGINGPIYALLVLQDERYEASTESAWNASKLVDYVLDKQNEDGGWTLAAGGKSTVDVTAMAVTALASHRGQQEVHAAVDRAVNWLKGVQLENGGFSDSGDNSESVAQVIIALSAIGIDAQELQQSGGDALSHLLTFRQADGGFAHIAGHGSDGMATEQALMALLTYQVFAGGAAFQLYQDISPEQTFVPNEPVANEAGGFAVNVIVEGIDGPVASGEVRAETAYEALMKLLEENKIAYHVEHYSFGDYVDEVDGLTAGSLGGYDGWSYEVKRHGSWSYPGVGIDAFALKADDQVIYYYSNGTALIHSVSFEPVRPEVNKPFSILVKKSEWDWDANKEVVAPATGVQVDIAGMTATTDDNGFAAFAQGIPTGEYTVIVSANRDQDAPAVVRTEQTLYVYEDQSDVSAWAAADIQKALGYGLIVGHVNDRVVIQPKRSINRAEYAALLLRLIGQQTEVVQEKPFEDVPVSAWYSGVVAKAKQLGILDVEADRFEPTEALKRADMAVMTARALGLAASSEPVNFTDLQHVDDASLSAIGAVAAHGILVGSDGKFMPETPVSREMAAAVAVRIYEMER